MRMRIGIDARLIEWPGIGRYINELVKNLAGNSKGSEFVIYYGSQESLKKYSIDSPNINSIVFPAAVFSIAEQFHWYRQIKKDRLAVFHSPHYATPLICPCTKIVTIHDMVGFRYPQYLFSLKARIYYQWMTRASALLSADIIVDSKFTKQEVIDILSIDEEKIHVIYLGVNSTCFQTNALEIEKTGISVQLPEEYFLYLGTKKPWKNLGTLLEAYKLFLDAGYSTKLVLAGKDARHQDDISAKVSKLNLEDSIIEMGEINEEDLTAVYQGAIALLFPSYYEGFGLPVLEAMASGIPVIVANAASLPEVVGNAGILVDPFNTQDLANSIITIASQEDVQSRMKYLGHEHAKQFTWQLCAESTMKVYEKHTR